MTTHIKITFNIFWPLLVLPTQNIFRTSHSIGVSKESVTSAAKKESDSIQDLHQLFRKRREHLRERCRHLEISNNELPISAWLPISTVYAPGPLEVCIPPKVSRRRSPPLTVILSFGIYFLSGKVKPLVTAIHGTIWETYSFLSYKLEDGTLLFFLDSDRCLKFIVKCSTTEFWVYSYQGSRYVI